MAAAAAGADRLELCQNLREGGLTPSLGLCEAVRAAVHVPVFAMLRPRPGDFLYDEGEFDTMCRDATHLAAAGVDGLVTGALRADGSLDHDRLRILRACAAALPFTCHRAFDLCADADAALATLAALGFARVLTSGQATTALAGVATIRRCLAAARGKVVIMAGAGVRDTNVRALVDATGVAEVHLSATTWTASPMTFRRDGVAMGSGAPADEYARRATDGALVARVLAALHG